MFWNACERLRTSGELGASMVEYGLLLAGVATVVWTAIGPLGSRIRAMISAVGG